MAERKSPIDPAVANLLGGLQRQAQERAMPKPARQKLLAGRKKKAKRNRVMLDIPPELEKRLAELAEDQECPISQVATRLMLAGLVEVEAGRLDLAEGRTRSKSPRYSWNLKLE